MRAFRRKQLIHSAGVEGAKKKGVKKTVTKFEILGFED